MLSDEELARRCPNLIHGGEAETPEEVVAWFRHQGCTDHEIRVALYDAGFEAEDLEKVDQS